MPKSLLTTAEIKSMWKEGASVADIAREAQVTRRAIYHRLREESHRKRELLRYSSLSDSKRRAFLAAQSKYRQRSQDESAKLAHKKGVPLSDKDLEYIEKHKRSRTASELAAKLGRTVYVVQKIARRRNISLRN